jgi:phosphatidylserine/phosphatidylglycerophosphate/cardiolipin synthase-like enzyme
MRPVFIDNQDLSLRDAIRNHIRWRIDNNRNMCLDIATGYINPQAFEMLADELDQCERIRILFGADPLPPSRKPEKRLGEREENRQQRIVNEAMLALQDGLEHDRNLIGFTPEEHNSVQRMINLLRSEKVQVMRYPGRFLHGKAYIFGQGDDRDGYFVGSSNFTAAGLTSNLELNVGRYDPDPVNRVGEWFDTLWSGADLFDLASI